MPFFAALPVLWQIVASQSRCISDDAEPIKGAKQYRTVRTSEILVPLISTVEGSTSSPATVLGVGLGVGIGAFGVLGVTGKIKSIDRDTNIWKGGVIKIITGLCPVRHSLFLK